MSRQIFDDECPGCRPVIIDPATRKVLADESPIVQSMNKIWSESSRSEREAFHRVTCLNSRNPEDLTVMQSLVKRIESACQENLRLSREIIERRA